MGFTPPESAAERFFTKATMRMIGDGVPLPDLERVKSAVTGWSQWFDAWAAVAEDHEVAAAAAEDAGHNATAGEEWWLAAMCWQYAQFMWFHDLNRRREGQIRKELAYRCAAPLLDPPAELLEIPFRDGVITAFERTPRTSPPWPAVVMLGGLESTKEESRRMEDMMLARGVATITFDGPGQGETARFAPLDERFDLASTAVLDHLLTRVHLDPERIAILGRSLGGFFAPLSAARDQRFAACVSFGALFDLEILDGMDPIPAAGFRTLTGISDPDLAATCVRSIVDLSKEIGNVRCPLLVVHGALDGLIPVDHAHRTAEGATNAEVTCWILEDGDHCGHNQHHRIRPAVADWVADVLRAGEPDGVDGEAGPR